MVGGQNLPTTLPKKNLSSLMMSFVSPTLEKTEAQPIYLQIAENLLEQIESGALNPGQRLPPERELSKTLGVNRMTLRQALRLLQTRGLLIRRQGDGTYVAPPKIERQADQLVSFSLGMRRRGLNPGAKNLVFERRPAKAHIARFLEIEADAPVYYFLRLRTLAGEPVMLEKFWMAVARYPDLEAYDLTQRPLYEILQEDYGCIVMRARQSLEPVVATHFEADLLDIGAGLPLMLERRLSYDQDELPIEYGEDLYRGDRFRFITERAPIEADSILA